MFGIAIVDAIKTSRSLSNINFLTSLMNVVQYKRLPDGPPVEMGIVLEQRTFLRTNKSLR